MAMPFSKKKLLLTTVYRILKTDDKNYLIIIDRVVNHLLRFVIYPTFKLFGSAGYRKKERK